MRRTTIFVPEPLERDLQLYARRAQTPVASVVREAIAEYLTARQPKSMLPSFTGIANSGRTDTAERHEEQLWNEPHGGPPPGAATRSPANKRLTPRKPRR